MEILGAVLLAQVAWSLANIAIGIIIIGAVIAIVILALRAMGITIPPAVQTIIWIAVVAVVAVLAIKFVLGA